MLCVHVQDSFITPKLWNEGGAYEFLFFSNITFLSSSLFITRTLKSLVLTPPFACAVSSHMAAFCSVPRRWASWSWQGGEHGDGPP